MKYLQILLIFLLPLAAQAQMPKAYYNEISIGYNHIGHFGDKLTPVSPSFITSHFNFSYKIRFEQHTLRSGINFQIFPETTYKYWVKGLNAGYEYHFNTEYARLQPFVGADIVVYYDITRPLGDTSELFHRYLSFGIAPVAGLRLMIHPRLSLTTELAPAFVFTHITQARNINFPEDQRTVDTKLEMLPHRFFSISLGYNFDFGSKETVKPDMAPNPNRP